MQASAGLAFYLVWLNAVPLEGVLLPSWADPNHFTWFMGAHVFALWICPYLPSAFLAPVMRYGFILLGGLSLSLHVIPSYTSPLFLAMGLLAAPLVFHALVGLKRAKEPLISAGVSLMVGNTLPHLLHLAPLSTALKLGAISVLLCTAGLFLSPAEDSLGEGAHGKKASDEPKRRIWVVYLFLAVFYVTGGILHGYLFPKLISSGGAIYHYVGIYLMMVGLGILILRRSHDFGIYVSVILGVVCFSLVVFDGRLLRHLCMGFSYASFGVFDLLVIALVVSPERQPPEGFRIMGSMCGGILVGALLVGWFEAFLPVVLVAAHVVLVGTLALFYHFKVLSMEKRRVQESADESLEYLATLIPKPFLKRISEKEKRVLTLVVQGCTYKEVASKESISESTVKTHMQRLFVKFECHSRKELLEKIHSSTVC